MAWEMQEHMRKLILPSLYAKAEGEGSRIRALRWAAARYADVMWTEAAELVVVGTHTEDYVHWRDYRFEVYTNAREYGIESAVRWALQALVQGAEDYATTNNGGYAFYLSDKWTTVSWCSEEYATDFTPEHLEI